VITCSASGIGGWKFIFPTLNCLDQAQDYTYITHRASSIMSTRNILVTGATGKQGGALIKALLAKPPPYDHRILALTRKTTSAAAKALAANPKVTLIEGDLENAGNIFTKVGGVGSVFAVFCVVLPSMKKSTEGQETRQGINLIDAALAHNVKHFVYSSVDRGGADQSEVDATNVPHFITKASRLG
jgi:uncharacterized protein YbjT (DUF2867 family)